MKQIIFILFLLELFFLGNFSFKTVPLNVYYPKDAIVEYLQADKDDFCVFPIGTFKYNSGMVFGIKSIKGASSFMFKHYALFLNIIDDTPFREIYVYTELYDEVSNYKSDALGVLNIKYIISKDIIDYNSLKFVMIGEDRYLYLNKKWRR